MKGQGERENCKRTFTLDFAYNNFLDLLLFVCMFFFLFPNFYSRVCDVCIQHLTICVVFSLFSVRFSQKPTSHPLKQPT